MADVVRVAIPFRSLRFPRRSDQTDEDGADSAARLWRWRSKEIDLYHIGREPLEGIEATV
jgi:hypothetical protein